MTTFSVIMPAYNYGRYVREAVSSVLDSSFTDFELIVVDDCSTDDTWSILQSFNDSRLVALRQDVNAGASAALNRGLRMARGEYLSFINSDDRYHRDFLQRVHDVFTAAGPELGVVGTYLRPVDADGQLIPHAVEAEVNRPADFSDPATWVWQNHFSGGAGVRRTVFEAVGEFSEDIASLMDWDLWIRALVAGFGFEVIPEALHDWRQHGKNITNRDARVTLDDYSLVSQRHLHPYLVSTGREDLLAANVAGFLSHEALITAEPTFVVQILSRVFDDLAAEQRAAAIQACGTEQLRLRQYYVGEAPRVEYLQGLTASAELQASENAAALRETQYELTAALDRLGAAEADRRVAQAELAAMKNSPLRRVGRKVKRRLGR